MTFRKYFSKKIVDCWRKEEKAEILHIRRALETVRANRKGSKVSAWEKYHSQRSKAGEYFHDIRRPVENWRFRNGQNSIKRRPTNIHPSRHPSILCPINDSKPVILNSSRYLVLGMRLILFNHFRTSISISHNLDPSLLRYRKRSQTNQGTVQHLADQLYIWLFAKGCEDQAQYIWVGDQVEEQKSAGKPKIQQGVHFQHQSPE